MAAGSPRSFHAPPLPRQVSRAGLLRRRDDSRSRLRSRCENLRRAHAGVFRALEHKPYTPATRPDFRLGAFRAKQRIAAPAQLLYSRRPATFQLQATPRHARRQTHAARTRPKSRAPDRLAAERYLPGTNARRRTLCARAGAARFRPDIAAQTTHKLRRVFQSRRGLPIAAVKFSYYLPRFSRAVSPPRRALRPRRLILDGE